MASVSRRTVIADAAAALAIGAAGSLWAPLLAPAATAAATLKRPFEQFGPAHTPYTAIRVLDTANMPIESPATATGWGTKTLYSGPDGEQLRILYVPPGAEGAKVHYHEFHEWAYNIAGDFTNNESTMPDQVFGPLQRFREEGILK